MNWTYYPDREHEEPSFRSFYLFTVFFWFFAGISVVVNWLFAGPGWLAFYVLLWLWFLTVGRWTTCARCERYGKNCGSMGLGHLTALYLPRRQGRHRWSYLALIDIIACVLILFSPLFFIFPHRGLFVCYLTSLVVYQVYHGRLVCRRCPMEMCPMHKYAVWIYGDPQ